MSPAPPAGTRRAGPRSYGTRERTGGTFGSGRIGIVCVSRGFLIAIQTANTFSGTCERGGAWIAVVCSVNLSSKVKPRGGL